MQYWVINLCIVLKILLTLFGNISTKGREGEAGREGRSEREGGRGAYQRMWLHERIHGNAIRPFMPLLLQINLFEGEVKATATLAFDVKLKQSQLSGVRKVKVHSHPPGRCLTAIFWMCYDLAIENKAKSEQNFDFSQKSRRIHHLPIVNNIRDAEPSSGHNMKEDEKKEVAELAVQRIKRAAASGHSGPSSDSSTTPRACKHCSMHTHT